MEERGLDTAIPIDRPPVDGICSRLLAAETPAAVATQTQGLCQDAAWQATLQHLEPTFGTMPIQGLRWRFELYRTPAGPGRTQAGKGIQVEAGTGNRSG